MKKKAFIACLASSLLFPALFSCVGEGGGASSSSSSIEIKNKSLAEFLTLYNQTTESDTNKASNFNLTLTRDLYYKGIKRNQYVAAFDANVYKNEVTTLTSKDQSYAYNTKTGEMDKESEKGFYHEFGYKHNLFIDAFYTLDEDGKTLNTLRSSSIKMDEENAKSLLNSGYIDMAGISNQATASLDKLTYAGAYDFLTYNYFGDQGELITEEAQENVEITSSGNIYTLKTYFDQKDDQDALYRHLFTFEFTFSDNHLVEIFGMEEEHLVSDDTVSEEITAASSLSITASFDEKEDSSVDFDRFFFTEYEILLGENPYSVSEVKDVKLNTRYFLKTTDGQPAYANPNIDKIRLESIVRNEEQASDSDVQFEADSNAITFLRGGNYVLTFISSNNIRATLEIGIETEEITSLSFKEYDWSYSEHSKGYLPAKTIVGEYTVKLEANNDKAVDDTRVELTDNTAMATITKSTENDFTYTLKATKAGSVTLKAFSAALGKEAAATKTVTFLSKDDKGIASLLTSVTWLPKTSYDQLKAISFTAISETTGTYKATIYQYETTGTYSVQDGIITVTKDEGSTVTQMVSELAFEEGNPNLTVKYKMRSTASELESEMHN